MTAIAPATERAIRITMHSISASSAGGMYGAFANWIVTAERRLAANKETTP